MKFLIVGDIVGRSGLDRLKVELKKRKDNVDFIIVNGENSASGKGLRTKEYEEIMSYGADVITMGNHMYYRKEMASEYKKLPRLIIPANLTICPSLYLVVVPVVSTSSFASFIFTVSILVALII